MINAKAEREGGESRAERKVCCVSSCAGFRSCVKAKYLLNRGHSRFYIGLLIVMLVLLILGLALAHNARHIDVPPTTAIC